MKGNEQICWSCNKACADGCCWFKNQEPVPNWVATETLIKATSDAGHKYFVKSYKIEKCPLYKCDNPVEELPTNVIASVTGLNPPLIREWRKCGKLEYCLKKHKKKYKKLESYYVDKI